LNLYTYCNNNPLIYVDPTGHGPEEHDFYRHLESISNKKLKIQKSSYLTGPLSRLGDGSYYVGFTGGYPIEFVTGRSVTSEERIRLNEKVFGNQRLVDIIFTMRYVSDTEFRRAVDEDNATDWKYEGMIYGAKTYPFTLVDTLTTLNSNKPLRSNSEFAQYRNLFNIVDVLKSDFPHKEPISYQNQQRFYNSVWKTQVGLDMAVNVISLGADLGIEALSSGRTISYLAYELDDAARYVDDVFRYIDDATTSINKGISLPKKSRMVEVDLQLFTRKPRVGNKGVRYIDNVTTSINKGISSSSKTRQYLKVDLQLFAEKGTSKVIDDVIKESLDGAKASVGNITSKYTVTADEALSIGNKLLGQGYKEVGKAGSGVFEKQVGELTYRFRIDNNSLMGKHAPNTPHIHVEILDKNRNILVNNHIPFIER